MTGHSETHSQAHHGHGHGHAHGHGHNAKEDEWDGAAFLARPGVKETAQVSLDSTLYALSQAGLSDEQIQGMDVLEVGSGPGAVTSLLLPRVSSIHAIETSPSMLLALSTNVPHEPKLSWSLHALSPSSSSEFASPLFSPTAGQQERKLVPPNSQFDLAIANLVLHHVHEFPPFFAGLLGVLKPGGYFVATEFGAAGGRDVVGEIRKAMLDENAKDKQGNKHHHIHPSFSTETIKQLLESQGLVNVHAEIRGTLPLWPDKEHPPCLIAWGQAPQK